jgi:hypothetical protein
MGDLSNAETADAGLRTRAVLIGGLDAYPARRIEQQHVDADHRGIVAREPAPPVTRMVFIVDGIAMSERWDGAPTIHRRSIFSITTSYGSKPYAS